MNVSKSIILYITLLFGMFVTVVKSTLTTDSTIPNGIPKGTKFSMPTRLPITTTSKSLNSQDIIGPETTTKTKTMIPSSLPKTTKFTMPARLPITTATTTTRPPTANDSEIKKERRNY